MGMNACMHAGREAGLASGQQPFNPVLRHIVDIHSMNEVLCLHHCTHHTQQLAVENGEWISNVAGVAIVHVQPASPTSLIHPLLLPERQS
jgi:hypothetical protein